MLVCLDRPIQKIEKQNASGSLGGTKKYREKNSKRLEKASQDQRFNSKQKRLKLIVKYWEGSV